MKQTLEFASHPGNLSMMRDYVRAFLATTSFTDLESDLMVLGIDEACTNIIRYAYDHEVENPIVLTCEKSDTSVTFRLRDHGRQCDPSTLQSRSLDEVKPGGLGLHLIRRAFDKVDFVLQDEGTELLLQKGFTSVNTQKK